MCKHYIVLNLVLIDKKMIDFKVQILEKKLSKWTTNWTPSPFFEKSKDFKTKNPLKIKGFIRSGYES